MNDSLERKIDHFLRTTGGDFDAVALELFAYQYNHNLAYRAFCKAQDAHPGNVAAWAQIPAVPVQAFKTVELTTTSKLEHAAAVFHSSGTTQKTPSRHFLRTLNYYEAALMASFSLWVLPDDAELPFFILAPAPSEMPRSSLSWMFDVVKRKWGAPGSAYFVQRGLVQDWNLLRALDHSQAQQKPVALLGTTLAFLTFFDQCEKQKKSFKCAPGSRLMDTGGMKTVNRDVSRGEFLRLVETYLGISEADCINEYGMCEMSSQFYTRGASPVFQGPPWVRSQVIDLQSGEPAGEGQTGVLRHFDLANVDSVLAIQTEDLGELRDGGFILKGRAPAADLKGCSIELEAYLNPIV